MDQINFCSIHLINVQFARISIE